MEPIEINAGAWYLRALRADDRIDDGPALAELGEPAHDHVTRSLEQWAADSCYTWAVCEPSTGELLAEVRLNLATGAVTTRAPPGHAEAAQTAAAAIRRFAAAALDIG